MNAATNDILLTVSGVIPADIEAQIAEGRRPQADYIAMARTFGADLLDYERARAVGGRTGRLLERIGGPNLMLAWACFRLRRRYRVIFTDGEQIGLPLAALLKLRGGARPQHLMLVHILSVGKKMVLLDTLRLQSHIDTFFVYATRQKQFIEARWQVPPERVVFTPFMVDEAFFAPEHGGGPVEVEGLDVERPFISAVGLEFRDYPSLLRAVDGLDVQVVIAAASPWSRRSDSTAGQAIPANVFVHRFSQHALRDVYAASAFTVMPLFNVEFQAGVTAILEAMAMEKAVICSRTPGQTDVIEQGETGMYVPPEDAAALRAAIVHLLEHPDEAARLGRNGRVRVEQSLSLAHYVTRLNKFVQQARRAAAPPPEVNHVS